MKTYLFSLIILCSILSCSKSSDVTPVTATTSYVSMKINGVEWKSSVGAGAISSGSFSATGALEVTGGKDAVGSDGSKLIITEGAIVNAKVN